MPWRDQFAINRVCNASRIGIGALPAAEGIALWAEFDGEIHRLYTIMNDGKESDLGD